MQPRRRYIDMLRPACRNTIDELLVAARGSDCDLDLALLRIGVYAPADLTPIKTLLTLDAVSARAVANSGGHCMIEVVRAGEVLGYITHNGDRECFVSDTNHSCCL